MHYFLKEAAFRSVIIMISLFTVLYSQNYSGGFGNQFFPYEISNTSDLKYLSEHKGEWDKHFKQTSDITFVVSDFLVGGNFYNNGEGFIPIGNLRNYFNGYYDGDNYSISGVKINRPDSSYQGFFGYHHFSTIKNIALVNVNIAGESNVGGVFGMSNRGVVENVTAQGVVSGDSCIGGVGGYALSNLQWLSSSASVQGLKYIGGLIGCASLASNNRGSIRDSYATGPVTGTSGIGGLLGRNGGTSSDGIDISRSYAMGDVSGTGNYLGGLIGMNQRATLERVYAQGNVTSSGWKIGGLVGYNYHASIYTSFATGSVNGFAKVGGLVGENILSGVSQAYATGSVEGEHTVGGLCGYHSGGGVREAYSTGLIAANTDAGGLIGGINQSGRDNTINSFWNSETSGMTTSNGGTRALTSEMKDVVTYTQLGTHLDAAWDFWGNPNDDSNDKDIWSITPSENSGYPIISTIPIPAMYSAFNISTDSASLKMAIQYRNGISVTDHGICWSTQEHPSAPGDCDSQGAGLGDLGYTVSVGGLTPSTTYYIRSYCQYDGETYYSNEYHFSTQGIPVWPTASSISYTSTLRSAVLSGGSASVAGQFVFSNDRYIPEFGSNKYEIEFRPSRSYDYSVLRDSISVTTHPKEITAINVAFGPKDYDGDTSIDILSADLSAVVSHDVVHLHYRNSCHLLQNMAGQNIPVSTTMSIWGNDSHKYIFQQPTGLKATINRGVLQVRNATVVDKEYDRDSVATISGATLDGVISGDSVGLVDHLIGNFATHEPAKKISVTVAMQLSGPDSASYRLVQPTGLTGKITTKSLTLTDVIFEKKEFDSTEYIDIESYVLQGIYPGDSVRLYDTTGRILVNSVGDNRPVLLSVDLTGPNVWYYKLTDPGYLYTTIYPVGGIPASSSSVIPGSSDVSQLSSMGGISSSSSCIACSVSSTMASSDTLSSSSSNLGGNVALSSSSFTLPIDTTPVFSVSSSVAGAIEAPYSSTVVESDEGTGGVFLFLSSSQEPIAPIAINSSAQTNLMVQLIKINNGELSGRVRVPDGISQYEIYSVYGERLKSGSIDTSMWTVMNHYPMGTYLILFLN